MLKRALFTTILLLLTSAALFAREDRNVEKEFLGIPQADSCRRNLFILTQQPHVAGSVDDSELAVFMKDRFQRYGLDARIVTYYVYLPLPRSESLQMTAPDKHDFNLNESGWKWDKDTYNSNAVTPFNAYSPSGDISGQIVYANYGLPEDYDFLHKMGIDVTDKIMLVRYGRSFRGIKVKVAEEHGAAGVIIYSDPADDGYDRGDIYPNGPMRPWTAVQRGSIQDLTVYPGDPLTPGYASTKDAKRIALNEVTDLPHIPCLPISYGNAQMLLSDLAGPVVPHDWQGGLPFAYHVGPGGTEVHMMLDMDYEIKPIWDVIAEIPGRTFSAEKVIVGNHRDAWVYGAVDPNSGTASLLETARGLGMLLKSGWYPERTIVLCSWDGEEYGLIGSTEWGEQNAGELTKGAVAYINIDAPVSGTDFGSSAVPSLDRFVMNVTKSVTDPKTGMSVFAAWYASQNKEEFEKIPVVPDSATTKLGRLGSGSDYTVFLDHLGVPALDFGFGGPYGVYHSVLDDYYWMEHWGDPTFEYHATVAKVLGIAAIRLADDAILPFRYSDYARQISDYVKERQKRAGEIGSLKSVDFSQVNQVSAEFVKRAEEVDANLAAAKPGNCQAINAALMEIERAFTDQGGLPKSAWFKHQIYAPGFYTGYASQPLPGVARAIEENDPAALRQEISILSTALKAATAKEIEILALIRK